MELTEDKEATTRTSWSKKQKINKNKGGTNEL
jgi:hypothetical protein